jgi:hypothetical protein
LPTFVVGGVLDGSYSNRSEVEFLSEPAVELCLCDLASGLVRKLQGTEVKVSEPDIQKNNSAQDSLDGFVFFRCK